MIDMIFVFILGACVGSFLNVCIYRWPRNESVVAPRSHCGQCLKTIPWYHNIPLGSYWLLGGKCGSCGAKFSMRYFWVELLTALMFLGFWFYGGWAWTTAAYVFMTCCFIVAVFTDFDHRIIPDQVSVDGMIFGLFFSFFIPELHRVSPMGSWLQTHVMSLGWSSFGILVGGGIIYALAVLGDLIFRGVVDRSFLKDLAPDPDALFEDLVANGYLKKKGYITSKFTRLKTHDEMVVGASFEKNKEKIFLLVKDSLGTMGGGDIKLMAMIGSFLGWERALITFFLAPFFGAIVGGIQKIKTGDSTLPYGPYIVLAALLSLFFGRPILLYLTGIDIDSAPGAYTFSGIYPR